MLDPIKNPPHLNEVEVGRGRFSTPPEYKRFGCISYAGEWYSKLEIFLPSFSNPSGVAELLLQRSSCSFALLREYVSYC